MDKILSKILSKNISKYASEFINEENKKYKFEPKVDSGMIRFRLKDDCLTNYNPEATNYEELIIPKYLDENPVGICIAAMPTLRTIGIESIIDSGHKEMIYGIRNGKAIFMGSIKNNSLFSDRKGSYKFDLEESFENYRLMLKLNNQVVKENKSNELKRKSEIERINNNYLFKKFRN